MRGPGLVGGRGWGSSPADVGDKRNSPPVGFRTKPGKLECGCGFSSNPASISEHLIRHLVDTQM